MCRVDRASMITCTHSEWSVWDVQCQSAGVRRACRTRQEDAMFSLTGVCGMCSANLQVSDVPVGPGQQDFMHTIAAGDVSAPPLVCIPGYGAGAAFYWRNLEGLGRVFRTYAVDLLGTGMSGNDRHPFMSWASVLHAYSKGKSRDVDLDTFHHRAVVFADIRIYKYCRHKYKYSRHKDYKSIWT
jgi:hypothetical protein